MKSKACLAILSTLALFWPLSSALFAGSKDGMPELCQGYYSTCLPTATTQLMLWFARNGYPKLLPAGLAKDDRESLMLHMVMRNLSSTFTEGTATRRIGQGIPNLVHTAGYDCDVNYYGINTDDQPLTPDVLLQNNDPHTGFVLVISYLSDSGNHLSDSGECHAVTLISYDPDCLIFQDSGREVSDPGRRMMTPELMSGGEVVYDSGRSCYPIAGLLRLSGSRLFSAPENTFYLLTEAIGITMHPVPEELPQVAQTVKAPGL